METRRFPNKLKSYRRANGYSQKKVARLLGLPDTSAISRWEHGISFPGLMQLFRLARIYHTQPQNLYDDLWSTVSNEGYLLAQPGEPVISNQSFYL